MTPCTAPAFASVTVNVLFPVILLLLPVAAVPCDPALLSYLECQYVLTFPSTALFQEPFACLLLSVSLAPAQLSAVAVSSLVGTLLYPDSLVFALHVQLVLASAVSMLQGTAPLVTIIPSAHAIATAFFMLFTFIFFPPFLSKTQAENS